jgi:hypothetical protein
MVRLWLAVTLVAGAGAQGLPPASTLVGKLSNPLQATDPAGNFYIAAIVNVAGLPVSPGAVQSSYAGGTCPVFTLGPPVGPTTLPCYDIYLAKLDPTGTTIIAATYLGGPLNDLPSALSVDAQGNIYVAGSSEAATFLPLAAPVAGFTTFIARLSTSLDRVAYGVALPATRFALDASANAWVIGLTNGSPGVSTLSRITPSGAVAFQEPISDLDHPVAIALDAGGNPVVVGPSVQAVQVAVVRFNSAGQQISVAFFGNADCSPSAAAVSPAGVVFVTGIIYGSGTVSDPPGGFFASVAPDGTSHRLTIGHDIGPLVIARDGRAFAVGEASAGVPTTPDASLRCRSSALLEDFVMGWDGVSAAPFYASYLAPLSSFPAIMTVSMSGLLTLTGPVIAPQPNVVTQIQPGAGPGQPACIDPLPANLANSRLFAAIRPEDVPPPIAPGEYVVFYGSGIGPETPALWDPNGDVPLQLAGVRLLMNGLPAPLLSVSANQIVAIMPLGLASGTAALEIDRDGATVATAQVPVTTATPVIFGASGTNFISPAVFNSDFS